VAEGVAEHPGGEHEEERERREGVADRPVQPRLEAEQGEVRGRDDAAKFPGTSDPRRPPEGESCGAEQDEERPDRELAGERVERAPDPAAADDPAVVQAREPDLLLELLGVEAEQILGRQGDGDHGQRRLPEPIPRRRDLTGGQRPHAPEEARLEREGPQRRERPLEPVDRVQGQAGRARQED
jgi:hypothetical protein